jgi:hypothetical protein
MAQKAGLSPEKLYQTMITCTADSKQLRGLEGVIVRGEYPSRTFVAGIFGSVRTIVRGLVRTIERPVLRYPH